MKDALRVGWERMAAGRELDALVAERVFGQQIALGARVTSDGPILLLDGEYLPCYSTDIAAAWEVVDALTREGFRVVVDADANGADVMVERDGAFFNDRAPAAPLAICRSAIAAVCPAVNPAHSGNHPASEPAHPE